jgi:hypothetical protein
MPVAQAEGRKEYVNMKTTSLILQKFWPIISMTLLVALIVSFLFYPKISVWVGVILFFSNLGMAFFLLAQKHVQPYKQGQITRVKLTRNILLDGLGLLLIICAASYLGVRAGGWAGSYGTWTGFVVGMAVGFSAAWLARQAWARVAQSMIARIP